MGLILIRVKGELALDKNGSSNTCFFLLKRATISCNINARSYLKKVCWPNLYVGLSFQVLEILEYVCGLKLSPALLVPKKPFGGGGTLSQDPIFEVASTQLRVEQLSSLVKLL